MAYRKVVLEGDEILRKHSRKVETFDEKLHILLDDMAQTMYRYEGVGLAAVQVGVLKRAIVIDTGDGLIELINPEIVASSGVQEGNEGCLSCPGEYGIVKRPNFVTVKAQDRYGNWFEKSGSELLARAFCHEIDHLDGKIFKDLATDLYRQEEKPKRKFSLKVKKE